MTERPVLWVSAFIDVTPDLLDAATTYWTSVTGTEVGEPKGDDGEFLPLQPRTGDPCLWLQRTQDGPVSCHPDLYVEDVDAAGRHAVDLGASRLRAVDGLVVLASPGGLPFCLVRHRGQLQRPEPVGEAGVRSIVDQICLDIPPDRFDEECEFWSALTGWRRIGTGSENEFNRLVRPPGIPYAFLLQRLDDDQRAVTAHLDLACDDRAAETARQHALGAQPVRRTPGWTVMRDPVGLVYCITERLPGDV